MDVEQQQGTVQGSSQIMKALLLLHLFTSPEHAAHQAVTLMKPPCPTRSPTHSIQWGSPRPHTVGLTPVTSSARSQPVSPPWSLGGAHFSSLTSTPNGLSSMQVKLVLRSWKLKELKCRSRRRITSEPRSSSLRDEGFRQSRVPPLVRGGDGGGGGGGGWACVGVELLTAPPLRARWAAAAPRTTRLPTSRAASAPGERSQPRRRRSRCCLDGVEGEMGSHLGGGGGEGKRGTAAKRPHFTHRTPTGIPASRPLPSGSQP